jgi:hypothetical protein
VRRTSLSLGDLRGDNWRDRWAALPRSAAGSLKAQATFSDGLARGRPTLWAERNFVRSVARPDPVIISRQA